MRFGETSPLKSAKGKLGVGAALLIFGLVAVLAAPGTTDKLLCALVPLLGAVIAVLGIRQDREDKKKLQEK